MIPGEFSRWVGERLTALGDPVVGELCPLRVEASTRRYFRIATGSGSAVAALAPPASENNQAFVALAKTLSDAGVPVPRVFAADLEQGFLLMEDLGDGLYQQLLGPDNAHQLIAAALDALVAIQSCQPAEGMVPHLDEATMMEQMALFETWLLEGLLDFAPDPAVRALLADTRQRIAAAAAAQPQGLCHFDFECRNLMALPDGRAGVLDFQDACIAPLAMDVAGLLKDLYIRWPERRLRGWLGDYLDKAVAAEVLEPVSVDDFAAWFDLAGMQRQLRIAGVLARLHLRDGKSFRLADIPTTLDYLLGAARRRTGFVELADFLETQVLPRLTTILKPAL